MIRTSLFHAIGVALSASGREMAACGSCWAGGLRKGDRIRPLLCTWRLRTFCAGFSCFSLGFMTLRCLCMCKAGVGSRLVRENARMRHECTVLPRGLRETGVVAGRSERGGDRRIALACLAFAWLFPLFFSWFSCLLLVCLKVFGHECSARGACVHTP